MSILFYDNVNFRPTGTYNFFNCSNKFLRGSWKNDCWCSCFIFTNRYFLTDLHTSIVLNQLWWKISANTEQVNFFEPVGCGSFDRDDNAGSWESQGQFGKDEQWKWANQFRDQLPHLSKRSGHQGTRSSGKRVTKVRLLSSFFREEWKYSLSSWYGCLLRDSKAFNIFHYDVKSLCKSIATVANQPFFGRILTDSLL